MAVGLGCLVTVVVRVVSISAPVAVDDQIVHRVTLRASDQAMDTLALADDDLLPICEWALRRGVLCAATGAFVAEERGDKVFMTLYDARDCRVETIWSITSREMK